MKYAPFPEADGFAQRQSFYYKDTMVRYAAECMRLNNEEVEKELLDLRELKRAHENYEL